MAKKLQLLIGFLLYCVPYVTNAYDVLRLGGAKYRLSVTGGPGAKLISKWHIAARELCMSSRYLSALRKVQSSNRAVLDTKNRSRNRTTKNLLLDGDLSCQYTRCSNNTLQPTAGTAGSVLPLGQNGNRSSGFRIQWHVV